MPNPDAGGLAAQPTIRSWRQQVTEADPHFLEYSLRPFAYDFSNGRRFKQPADPYGNPAGAPVITVLQTLLAGASQDWGIVGTTVSGSLDMGSVADTAGSFVSLGTIP